VKTVACTALLAAAMAIGCDTGSSSPSTAEAPPSRTVGVAADPAPRVSLDELCEVRAEPEERPRFAMPELATEGPGVEGDWRWVNVWATWCRPCVEEMPRLVEWKDRLRTSGVSVDLVFISADRSDEEIAAFREEHPNIPGSARIADVAGLSTWVTTFGLDEGATLPIHVFVDPAGDVRCARTGGVADADFPAVQQLLSRAE
jgi:thiol-disulfide isomerase/thioredoxin